MSVYKGLDVPQLVKKYREKYPELDRDLLRKLIRLEAKITNPSQLKKLDRYLAKEFKGKQSDKPFNFSRIQQIYEKIIDLRLTPQLRLRQDDGTFYYSHNFHEILSGLAILREMSPSLRSIIPENLGRLPSEEIDKVIGKIGCFIYSLKE
ncbi:MAG: hypothetical protein QXJ11_03470 [Candidatus Bathyarchaeia archaeon]